MPKYKFWYKKEVEAKHLSDALKKEKKTPLHLDSVVLDDDKKEVLMPAIGFQIDENYDSDTDE